MTPPVILHDYRRVGAIGRDDISTAAVLVALAAREGGREPDLLGWLGLCLALRTVRDGHTCVDYGRIGDWAAGLHLTGGEPLAWPQQAADWLAALRAIPALVGQPGDRRPFILDGHRLYLGRSLAEEQTIAATLMQEDCQRVRILLGGPGTGKTTKVARDLVERLTQLPPGQRPPRLALTAPTGKAASRMTDVLRARCLETGAPADVVAAVTAEPARTVHKLLGFNPAAKQPFTYHAGNRLPHDLVIVDEASMLSSSLMHHLLVALAPDAEILLVGDPDQLASVAAGTVLGDLAVFRDDRFADHPLHGRIETLTINHRAKHAPGIVSLADAIRRGDTAASFAVLESQAADVTWVDPTQSQALEKVTALVVAQADRLREVAKQGDADAVLTAQAELQVLCGHREGSLGVAGWNARIEQRLGVAAALPWYAGRPVMVTRNSRSLALFNGDVGVTVPVAGQAPRLEAIFGQPGQTVRVPVSRLEDVATVHALTIHKSQGSEYEHAVVVLPERPSRIVTRELLYTGITRARSRVTVVGSREVIEAAVEKPIRRATGLAERMG
jgi:exodeoxyribonuclease V alpha subunit